MSLQLYGHPFSSYTQKVLVALYENATPFSFHTIAPDQPHHTAEWLRRWPLRKFPLLVDNGQTIAETSIIIEHLHLAHPSTVPLLPADPRAALHVRFLDRFFDLHVMNAMQIAVDGALTNDPAKRREGQTQADEKLTRAYAWLEAHLPHSEWAAGPAFSLADCAAAPSLFYADWTLPIPAKHPRPPPGACLLRSRHRRGPAVSPLFPPRRSQPRLMPTSATDSSGDRRDRYRVQGWPVAVRTRQPKPFLPGRVVPPPGPAPTGTPASPPPPAARKSPYRSRTRC